MTIGRRPFGGVVEGVMLAGAWIAPFDFLFRPPGIGLHFKFLHLWLGVALLLVAVSDRDRLLAAIDWPVLAFWTMFAFIVLSTLLATPGEYRPQGLIDIRFLFLNVLLFTVIRGYYAARPEAWDRFFLHLGASSVVMASLLIVRAIAVGNTGHAVGLDSFALGLGTVAGTYTAAFAAAGAGAIVFATTRVELFAGLTVFIVHGIAMVFALARGPWLAFAIGLVTMVPLAAWRFGRRFTVASTAARGIAILLSLPLFFRVAIAVNPFVRDMLVQRVVEVVDIESGTAYSRLVVWQAFLRDVGRSPV
ncbi:MAG: hypothetical protein ABIV11_07655, partial [Gemmatimonadaceae bacterium]